MPKSTPPIEQTTRGSNMDYRRRSGDAAASAGRGDDDAVDGAMASAPIVRLHSSADSTASHHSDPNLRHLLVNQSQQRVRFLTNHITTAKYNWLSFLPKFLFEQFRRYANIFFLCIGLLQQIPNVSPTGRFVTIVPFTVILALTAVKELIEDFKRHRADDKVNNSLVAVLNLSGQFDRKRWKDVVVGDVVRVDDDHFFPADLVLLASSEPQGMCYVETSNLDGETNLKIRSAVQQTCELDSPMKMSEFRGEVECEAPNRNLYEFKGNLRREGDVDWTALSPSSVLLRGAKLQNTQWVYGAVVYTGHETKLLMNSTQAPLKRSHIDKITNYQIIFLFLILVGISLISAAANEIQKHNGEDHSVYLGDLVSSHFFYNFLTFLILYNNLIPISLQVTLEFVKFTQAYFINWDAEMFYEPTQTPALARTSNLNEELGQIKYVFSDKTGTLTRNIMEFRKCSIAGIVYSSTEYAEDDESDSDLVRNLLGKHETAGEIEDFLVLMAVCHTVIPEPKGDTIFYNASSPDEKALVEGAARYGYEFVGRKPDSVLVRTPTGAVEEWEVLNVVEFTSTRKRMTVIVRSPKGKIKLLCKGADTVVMERLGKSQKQRRHQRRTIEHLELFAKEGLRTLVLATREIDDDEYDKWARTYHRASTDVTNKEDEIEKAAELVERDLTLLGATAIEDKLQDGVPETIAQLLEANIHVWVLTGDKQETAINIGHSAKLLREGMPVIVINSSTLDETRDEICEQLENFRREDAVGKDNEVAVVVDGKTLTFALDHSLRKDFLDLCCSCQSVICCRVSPIQKAEMVELVQENTGSISLAIGDGANDVAMIQKADVGVGISGNEGLQAANSSDFAIAQFRYLARLLFVHGAWNYTRISKVILYSFYKNICLYIIELWFAFYNYWSGQVLFERWTIGLYNIFFTSCPPMAMGLFDQYCNADTRMRHPALYHSTQRSEYFNHRIFWLWISNSILHSVLLFWLPMTGYNYGVVWSNGHSGDYLVVGNIVYSFVVVTVCLKAGLEMESWSWVTHMSIWGSILFWFTFLVVYSFAWPLGLPLAANMAGMIGLIVSTPLFWMGLAVVPFATLMPDIVYKTVRVTAYTSEADKIRIAEIMKKDVGAYITSASSSGGLRLSEASSLLRNVRKVFSRKSTNRHAAEGVAGAAAAAVEGGGGGGVGGGGGGLDGDLPAAVPTSEEIELAHGYAFSQEEGGAVSQVEFIRRYDTTKTARGGTDRLRKLLERPSRFLRKRRRRKDDDEENKAEEEEDEVDRVEARSKKSLFGGHIEELARFGDKQQRQHAAQRHRHSQQEAAPPQGLKTSVVNESGASSVRAKHSELPEPQSPRKVNIVAKSRTDKRDAKTRAEVVPLRAKEEDEEEGEEGDEEEEDKF